MAIGSRLIIRRLWPLKPTDKFLFFILFFKTQARIFTLKCTSAMIQGQWTSDQASKSFERGSRLTVICKYHALDTREKLRKYIFYADFL